MSKTAWLIERRPSNGRTTEYLGMSGQFADWWHPSENKGVFDWHGSVDDALQFARRRDGLILLAIVRTMSLDMPLRTGVYGLRACDPMPEVCEHAWMDGPALEEPVTQTTGQRARNPE